MTSKSEPRLSSPEPRFIFYGGKGGVGKTTCAAARAVAEAAAGRRVLVVSTDPAHSLGDALAVRLSFTPRRVPPSRRGRSGEAGLHGGLYAAEIDAPRAFARWIDEHRAALGDILEHGTWLDREDIEALLELSMPGVDELMGLIEIGRLASARTAYDLVIVDTAPTGHTLRLLAAPDAVAAVAQVLDALQEEHRVIREQLARVGRPEAADRLIALLARQAHEIAARLRDEEDTSLHWVTLPEALSLAESRDAVHALEQAGIPVSEIIVNRVLPAPPQPASPTRRRRDGVCPICDRRSTLEDEVVAETRRALGRGRRLRVVPAAVREPRGVRALATIGRVLARDTARGKGLMAGKPSAISHRPSRGSSAPLILSLSKDARHVAAETIPEVRDATMLFVGGKGGVGKTTVAAATAVRLARAKPKQRVLLLSTDPAHSLGDVFGRPLGDRPSAIPHAPKNLDVRELDAPRALADRRVELEQALDEISSAVGSSTLPAAELLDLAPPGIDELFGILSVVDAADEYHTIVIDTAPTGHALRLLELPETAREWVQLLLRVLLKYRSLVRPGQLAAELVRVSKSIRALQTRLRDTRHTHFIVVTRAAQVPLFETERLIDRLRRLKLSAPAVVVNAMTLAPGRCARCRATAAAERAQVTVLRRALARSTRLARRSAKREGGCAIIQTPLAAPPPRGARALEFWGARWNMADG